MKTGFTRIYLIIYGAVLILVVRFVPEGLAGVAARWRTRAQRPVDDPAFTLDQALDDVTLFGL